MRLWSTPMGDELDYLIPRARLLAASLGRRTDDATINVMALREALGLLGADQKVNFKCFSRGEAQAVYDLLTPSERERVVFTWYVSRHMPLDDPCRRPLGGEE